MKLIQATKRKVLILHVNKMVCLSDWNKKKVQIICFLLALCRRVKPALYVSGAAWLGTVGNTRSVYKELPCPYLTLKECFSSSDLRSELLRNRVKLEWIWIWTFVLFTRFLEWPQLITQGFRVKSSEVTPKFVSYGLQKMRNPLQMSLQIHSNCALFSKIHSLKEWTLLGISSFA